jgi:hypothetical protein
LYFFVVLFQHPENTQQIVDGVKAVEELVLSRPTHTGEYRQLVPPKQVLYTKFSY